MSIDTLTMSRVNGLITLNQSGKNRREQSSFAELLKKNRKKSEKDKASVQFVPHELQIKRI